MRKTPERIESLAAAYVLGTLRGPARRRFERWMLESISVRQEVWAWEARLGELATKVPAEEPPAHLWQAIERRLWPVSAASTQTNWRGWWPVGWIAAAAASVMLVLVLLGPLAPEPPVPGLAGAAVQQGTDEPVWLISQSSNQSELLFTPVAAVVPEHGHDYELWVLPQQGNPVSLGVLVADQRQVAFSLSQRQRELLQQSRTLAISLEPLGGSPTGLPTGEILHVVRLHSS